MAVSAVAELKGLTVKRQYGEIVQLLEAVIQLSDFFSSFESIKKIDQIKDDVLAIKRNLKRQIFDDFDACFTTQGSLTGGSEQLALGARIIDILGADPKYLIS